MPHLTHIFKYKLQSNPSLNQNPKSMMSSNVCLVILNGWGVRDEPSGNAVANAYTPAIDRISSSYTQYLTLKASGVAVGLPDGQPGSGQTGHMTIGCGRVAAHTVMAINADIASKGFDRRENLLNACNSAISVSGGRIHLIGLASDAGPDGRVAHVLAALEAAKQHGVARAYVHLVTDGWHSRPRTAHELIHRVLAKMRELGYGSLATVMGRHFAMDSHNNWKRTETALDCLLRGKGRRVAVNKVVDTVMSGYEEMSNYAKDEKKTDQYIEPIILDENGLVRDNDTVIFLNFGPNRMRQLVAGVANFWMIYGGVPLAQNKVSVYTMTAYNPAFPFPVIYPALTGVTNTLPSVISDSGLLQFRCGESEKYEEITRWLNGGHAEAFAGEERLEIESPRVDSYAQMPGMSCREVAVAVADAIKSQKYSFVACNFASPDIVGHTGNFEATIDSCAAADWALEIIISACVMCDYVLVVTGDHGNAELMRDSTGQPNPGHTNARVPFIITNTHRKLNTDLRNRGLIDVAPTVLELMAIERPNEWTGVSLLENDNNYLEARVRKMKFFELVVVNNVWA